MCDVTVGDSRVIMGRVCSFCYGVVNTRPSWPQATKLLIVRAFGINLASGATWYLSAAHNAKLGYPRSRLAQELWYCGERFRNHSTGKRVAGGRDIEGDVPIGVYVDAGETRAVSRV